jgi:predicted nucleic acid-binding protein
LETSAARPPAASARRHRFAAHPRHPKPFRHLPVARPFLDQLSRLLLAFSCIAMDDEIVEGAMNEPDRGLRSLDAIHLATARLIGEDLDAIVSYDDRLLQAADGVGLPTLSPRDDNHPPHFVRPDNFPGFAPRYSRGEFAKARLGVPAHDGPSGLSRMCGDDQVMRATRGAGPAGMGEQPSGASSGSEADRERRPPPWLWFCNSGF